MRTLFEVYMTRNPQYPWQPRPEYHYATISAPEHLENPLFEDYTIKYHLITKKELL